MNALYKWRGMIGMINRNDGTVHTYIDLANITSVWPKRIKSIEAISTEHVARKYYVNGCENRFSKKTWQSALCLKNNEKCASREYFE